MSFSLIFVIEILKFYMKNLWKSLEFYLPAIFFFYKSWVFFKTFYEDKFKSCE